MSDLDTVAYYLDDDQPASYTYDPQAGATYVYLDGPTLPGGVARTVEADAMVNLDYGPDGRIIGIEILGAWPEAPAAFKEERKP